MEYLDRIKELCALKKITIAKLERELGFGNGSVTGAKTTYMRCDRLNAIANYFGVTMDYLMNGTDAKANQNALIVSDQEREIILELRKQPRMIEAITRLLELSPHYKRHSAAKATS